MAVTLTSPDYDTGLTGITFIIDRENGTSTSALSASEVSGFPGTYSLSTSITNAPVGYNRIRMYEDGELAMIFAVQVIADGQATVTGGSVQGLRDRAANQAEHDATQAAVAAISLTGSGARTVTITVTDGTNPLASALVRVTSGVNSFTSLTNGSGVVVFNLDDGTWVVAITKSGYSYVGSSITVDGTETRTLAMTAVSVTPPPEIGLCRILVPTRKSAAPVAGVTVTADLVDKKSTTNAGISVLVVDSAVTDSNGECELLLPWTSEFTAGTGVYRIRARESGGTTVFHDRSVTIPDLSTAHISDLPTAVVSD